MRVPQGQDENPTGGEAEVFDGEAPPLTRTFPTTARPLYPLADNFRTSSWLRNPLYRIADDGALETDYGARYDNAGWQFSPVAASQFCYTAYNESVLTGDEGLRSQVLGQAEGLLARGERVNGALLWRYDFPQSTFEAGPGWISGMAQGLALACFAGAHVLSGDQRYLDAAAQAFDAMVAPFGDEGTAVPLAQGTFYEEVAGRGSKPAHILNGMVYALAGLWLLQEVDPRPEYADALAQGVAGVRTLLPQYDAPGVSLYDLGPKRVARLGRNYNLVHVAQLQWLHGITGDPEFLRMALRFLSYERAVPAEISADAAIPERGPENLSGTGSYFAAPVGQPVTLSFAYPAARLLDRLRVIAYTEESVPAEILVEAGGRSTRVEPDGRFLEVPIEPVETDRVRVRLRPGDGRRVALFFLGLSGPEERSLTPLSSDTSTYWSATGDELGPHHPFNLLDGDATTSWASDHERPWLLIDLGDLRPSRLRIEGCDAERRYEVRFTPDLDRWSRPREQTGGATLSVPADSRFLSLHFDGPGGCLSSIRPDGDAPAS